MPAFIIEKLPNEPIVIVHEGASYRPEEHMGQVIDALVAELEGFDLPGYCIFVSEGSYDFDGIMTGAHDLLVKGEKLRRLPQYRGTLMVVPNEDIKAVYAGMANSAMGGLVYHTFDMLDEALAYARANL